MMNTTNIIVSFLAADFGRVKSVMGDAIDGVDVNSDTDRLTPLVTLSFYGMENDAFGFERELQSELIPYSKEYADEFKELDGQEHFRVVSISNDTELKVFDNCDVGVVGLDTLGVALEQGFEAVNALYKRLKSKFDVLGWSEQLDIINKANP